MASAQRPRIVYITPNAVLPANRGGRIRSHHLWRAMSAFADVFPIMVGDMPPRPFRYLTRSGDGRYFPRRSYKPAALAKALEAGRDITLPGLFELSPDLVLPPEIWRRLGEPEALVAHCLNEARIARLVREVRDLRPDLIVLCDSSMGLLAPEMRALGVKVVVGPHNFDSELYANMALSAPTEHLRRLNEKLAQAFDGAERLMAAHVDQLWVCSAADARRFSAHLDPAKIKVIPNVYDLGEPTLLPADSNDLVYIGQANYFPNIDAIQRLYTISRQLDERGVAHRMRIIGKMDGPLQDMAANSPSVEILGQVPAIAPFIESAVIAPVALTMGGGTRLKILEALASARVVLSTPIGIEGIEVENGVHAVIEPDLEAFPERIGELLQDRERAQRIALAGWEFARDHYSHEALLRLMKIALTELGIGDGAPSDANVARNLGPSIVEETAVFNPYSRLLAWTAVIRVAAPHDVLSAEFDVKDCPNLANAFVTIKQRPHGLIALEATAVLPSTVSIDDVALSLYAWNNHILRHAAPADVEIQTAGILGLEATEEGLSLTGWVSDGEPTLMPETSTKVSDVAGPLPGSRLLRFDYKSIPETDLPKTLELATSAGAGQTIYTPGLWLGPYLQSSAKLRRLKDKHAGETAWLIGNGPSVKIGDLDQLKGKLTFAFNRFHLAYENTSLRPNYTFTGDQQMIEDFGQQIVDESGGTVFVAHNHSPDLLGDYIWLRQAPIFPPLFSHSPDLIVSPGGSTPFVAMQVAFFMGVRKFYLYGTDFSFTFDRSRVRGDTFRSASGEGNHFITNYRSGRPWCPPSLRDIGASFLAARMMIEAEGGFIRNATRGGLLEIFEREDFESAVQAEETTRS